MSSTKGNLRSVPDQLCRLWREFGTPGSVRAELDVESEADVDAAGDRHEVVAGIVVRGAQVLLCHRSADRAWYPDTWDLPGGHVNAGEVPDRALPRELQEELGISIKIPAGPEFARLQDADFDCRIWIVTEWVGTPSNMAPEEHDEVAWWSLSALPGLRLAHQDYPELLRRALS